MRRPAAALAAVAATALAAAGLAGAAAAPASAETVRVFAMGPRFDPSWVETRQAFRDKLVGMAAADVAPHLRGGGHDLVTLPEDVGLLAAFSGSRGTEARAAGDLVSAIVALLGTYAPVSAFYGEKFPALTRRALPTRQLVVALTDTFGRTAVETFAEIADESDAYVVAGVNMAREWRIVCESRAAYTAPPGGEPCAVEDPALVARLRSPDEPQRTYAYEATTPDAVNMGLVFDPDGKLISRQVKTYLTPIELPGQLDLKPGDVSGLTRVDTPAGRLGVVTSKDAWMPDVLGRLDAAGVDLLVQPEFFVGDTVGPTGMWSPDNIKASGYSAILRAPSFDALAMPSLTGNVFDFSADNQSQIAVKPRERGTPSGRLVGQDPVPGFAAVAPWVVDDPLGGPILARRERLAAVGVQLLPRPENPPCPTPAPGPCRGGQVEATIRHDVEVSSERPLRRVAVRATRPFSRAERLAPSRDEQRGVDLDGRGRTVWAVFGDGGAIRAAVSRDAGRTWTGAERLGPGTAPSVAVGPRGRVWVAWQQGSQVVLTTASRGEPFGRARPISANPARQWAPSIAATAGEQAYVAWVDERKAQVEGELPRATIMGSRISAGRTGPARELDTAPPANDLARQLDNDWAPVVAARGRRIVVAWTDFRTYDWRLAARSSADGGKRFAAIEHDVVDASLEVESLSDAPAAVVDRRGPVLAWTDYRAPRTIAPSTLYDIRAARPGGRNRRVDPHGGAQVSAFHPALALTPDGRRLVAWQ
ncbi:MAG TPA: nitrilase-related carbon-nitrogen hydrolase, partial [Capillimicrobium sp.]